MVEFQFFKLVMLFLVRLEILSAADSKSRAKTVVRLELNQSINSWIIREVFVLIFCIAVIYFISFFTLSFFLSSLFFVSIPFSLVFTPSFPFFIYSHSLFLFAHWPNLKPCFLCLLNAWYWLQADTEEQTDEYFLCPRNVDAAEASVLMYFYKIHK